MHKSLRGGDRFGGERNVLSRAERVSKLQKDRKMTEADSVFGLPKLRIIKLKHKKAKKEEEAVPADGTAPAEGAAPAAEAAKKEEPKK